MKSSKNTKTAPQRYMTVRLCTLLLLFIFYTLLVDLALAESSSIFFQNDVIARTDRHLTNSMGFEWTGDKLATLDNLNIHKQYGRLMYNIVDRLPGTDLQYDQLFTGMLLSHSIITPSDTSSRELIPDDLPYVGYFSTIFSLYQHQDTYFEQFRLIVGLLGPSVGGEQLQKSFHRLIDNDEPLGWKHQLKDQPILGTGYTYSIRSWQKSFGSGYRVNWLNSLSFDLGNFYTGASFASLIQLGKNYPENFNMVNRVPTNRFRVVSNFNSPPVFIGWSFVMGTYLNMVNHLYIIDCALDHDIERDTLVGNSVVGLHLHFNRFQISFNIQTIQLTLNQDSNIDKWGRITLSWF